MDDNMFGVGEFYVAVNRGEEDGGLKIHPFANRPQYHRGQSTGFELLNLPHDYLETLVLHHLPESSLGAVRASCRQLKTLTDRRLTRLKIQYDSMLRHSFWRTSALQAVTSLVLEMPGSTAICNVGAGTINKHPGPSATSSGTGPEAVPPGPHQPPHHAVLQHLPPLIQPQGILWQTFHPVQLLHTTPAMQPPPPLHAAAVATTVAAASAVASAAGATSTVQSPPLPLSALLLPVSFSGLRRHLPSLRHLKLRNVYFPPRDAIGAAGGGGGGAVATSSTSAAPSPLSDYPLNLSDLVSLSLDGLETRSGAVWRMQGANPFPSGLELSLARAASSLTSLSLSHVTFEGNSVNVLGCLTALVNLSIRSCNNFTSNGLTVLGQLTRLTSLAYVDVFYRTGIPNEMVVLSCLTRLRSANFSRCDLYADEVASWATWGQSLTRLEISSKWQMTLNAVPTLLPHLTSLEHLDLADHCLDRRMWRVISSRMPRLTSARFSWVNLPDRDESEDGEDEEEEGDEGDIGVVHVLGGNGSGGYGWRGLHVMGGYPVAGGVPGRGALPPQGADAGGGGGGGGGGSGSPAWHLPAGRGLRPLEGLRSLRLDGPWEGDECCWSILALMPQLEELRIGDDPAALMSIAEDDPGVYDRLERWMANSSIMLTPATSSYGGEGSSEGGGGGGASLRLLAIPTSWLQHLLGFAFPNLRTLRIHTLKPSAATAVAPSALLSEAQLRASWREAPGAAAAWPRLTELDVPRDLDAAALAPLCGEVRHLRISQSYGDGFLALMGVTGSSRPMPQLREVTLAGTLWSGMDPEAYHCALLLVLAVRYVWRVRATRGSCLLADAWWSWSRERLRRAPEDGQLVWPEVVVLPQEH